MIEIVKESAKLSDGTLVILTLLADVTEKETGEELWLDIKTPGGLLAIRGIPRKPFALAGIGLYRVGDVEDKSD